MPVQGYEWGYEVILKETDLQLYLCKSSFSIFSGIKLKTHIHIILKQEQ